MAWSGEHASPAFCLEIVCNHLAALRVRQRLKDPSGKVGLRRLRISSREWGLECLRGDAEGTQSSITGKRKEAEQCGSSLESALCPPEGLPSQG